MTDACTAAVNFKAPGYLVEALKELSVRQANPLSATVRRLLASGLEAERRRERERDRAGER